MIEQRLRSCIVLLAALSAMVGHPAAVRADPIDGGRIQVLDGDTIRLDGAKPDVRLVGFNAPGTTRARCAAERDSGELADRRLRELVQAGVGDVLIAENLAAPFVCKTYRCPKTPRPWC